MAYQALAPTIEDAPSVSPVFSMGIDPSLVSQGVGVGEGSGPRNGGGTLDLLGARSVGDEGRFEEPLVVAQPEPTLDLLAAPPATTALQEQGDGAQPRASSSKGTFVVGEADAQVDRFGL